MPELPEIKVMRRQIINQVKGQAITDFKVYNLKLKGGKISDFKNKITKHSIKNIDCLGEELVFKFSSSYYAWANLRSTGFFILVKNGEEYDNVKAEFIFKNKKRLLFVDRYRHSYFKLLTDSKLMREKVGLGVDPLGKGFNYSVFISLIKNRTTAVKKFLMNDKIFFGIGKVYADEICFEARIRPDRGMKTLKNSEVKRLSRALLKILKKSMEYDGLSIYLPESHKRLRFDRFLRVYDKVGQKCYRCSGKIKRSDIEQGLDYFYCPLCQN